MSYPRVIIPSSLESNLCTESGQQGADVRKALSMEEPSVGNLYSFDAALGQLKYAFREMGVAYNEKETSGLLSEASLDLKDSAPASFTLEFEEQAVQRWGISFCGVVRVKHAGGEVREVYLPGTRTYDPAGLTGRSFCPVWLTFPRRSTSPRARIWKGSFIPLASRGSYHFVVLSSVRGGECTFDICAA